MLARPVTTACAALAPLCSLQRSLHVPPQLELHSAVQQRRPAAHNPYGRNTMSWRRTVSATSEMTAHLLSVEQRRWPASLQRKATCGCRHDTLCLQSLTVVGHTDAPVALHQCLLQATAIPDRRSTCRHNCTRLQPGTFRTCTTLYQ